MIPLNIPTSTGEEQHFVAQLMREPALLSKGHFTKKCADWFKTNYQTPHLFLTKSCTSALEMTAMLVGIQPGDEVVLPSFTFVSAANAFVLRGARLIFVDIDPETMNIAPQKIEAAITEKTKAILSMHYAGMACDMERIMEIAQHHQLPVIEDAAHCINAKSVSYTHLRAHET